MMTKCKHCGSTNLSPLKDFKYHLEDEYIKTISGLKCDCCEAIYSFIDEKLDFWEFPVGNYKEKTNQVAGWAQN